MMKNESTKGDSHTRSVTEGSDCREMKFCTHATLVRQQCSAALRALAGRLAHQIRNPLAAIKAACGSLREELQDPDHQQ